MTKQGCIINPQTGRAVKTTTALGKKLMGQAQQLDDEYKGEKVIKTAAKRALAQKEAGDKNKAGGVLAAAAKRAMAKKPEPPKPAKKFGFEDLPGDVKNLITGVVKKNKSRKEMNKDVKEKLKGYKLPGYTKMTNEELYDWVYGGKLDKAIAELEKKKAEKQEEKNRRWVTNHILTLFRQSSNRYESDTNKSLFEINVMKYSVIPNAGFYQGSFEDGIRTDIGDGDRFIKYYHKDLSSQGTGTIPWLVAFKDFRSHVTFLSLQGGTIDKNSEIKRWRIYAKTNSDLYDSLNRIKELPGEYYDMDNFLERNRFKLDGNNIKYV